jgi:hypothetical protein
MLFLGICASSTGLLEYQTIYVHDKKTKIYMFLNILAAGGQIFIMELAYRLYNRYSKAELPIEKGTEPWSVDKIKSEAYDKKRKIVVLDNQVLDVEGFASTHPGGKFVFTKNYGRDISKFFYGGYKLV